MVKCVYCDSIYPDNVRSCKNCGASKFVKICSSCGGILDNDSFCRNCGASAFLDVSKQRTHKKAFVYLSLFGAIFSFVVSLFTLLAEEYLFTFIFLLFSVCSMWCYQYEHSNRTKFKFASNPFISLLNYAGTFCSVFFLLLIILALFNPEIFSDSADGTDYEAVNIEEISDSDSVAPPESRAIYDNTKILTDTYENYVDFLANSKVVSLEQDKSKVFVLGKVIASDLRFELFSPDGNSHCVDCCFTSINEDTYNFFIVALHEGVSVILLYLNNDYPPFSIIVTVLPTQNQSFSKAE